MNEPHNEGRIDTGRTCPSVAQPLTHCASIRATRTAGPLLWTTGTTTSVEANIQGGLACPHAKCQKCYCKTVFNPKKATC